MNGVVNVRPAELEDWEGVLKLWKHLKDSPHAMRIEGNEETLKSFFIGSLVSPHVNFLISIENYAVTGFVVTQTQLNPIPDRKGMVNMIPSCFIRAVYVDNAMASPETVHLMDNDLTLLAKQQGCVCIFGNCRQNFPARAAFKNYGYEAVHLVMRKDL